MRFICDFKVNEETFTLVRFLYRNTSRVGFEIIDKTGKVVVAKLSINLFNVALPRYHFLVRASELPKLQIYFDQLQHVFAPTGQMIRTKRDGKLIILRERNHGLLKFRGDGGRGGISLADIRDPDDQGDTPKA
jgi:hypothetical protein